MDKINGPSRKETSSESNESGIEKGKSDGRRGGLENEVLEDCVALNERS